MCLKLQQVQSGTLPLILCVKFITEANFETRAYIKDRVSLAIAGLQTNNRVKYIGHMQCPKGQFSGRIKTIKTLKLT